MSGKYKFHDQSQRYFISFAVVYWIDLFIRTEYKNIILQSLKFCQRHKGLEISGWCIMTSHIHLIIASRQEKLENIMRDMKRHTSIQLREAIVRHPSESRKEWLLELLRRAGVANCNNKTFQLWQQDNHPVVLKNMGMSHRALDYIHNNPVEAGIVERPEDYLYSSARDYYDHPGLLDIAFLDPRNP